MLRCIICIVSDIYCVKCRKFLAFICNKLHGHRCSKKNSYVHLKKGDFWCWFATTLTCKLSNLIHLQGRVHNGSPDGTHFYGPFPLRRHSSIPVSTGPYILGRPGNCYRDTDNLHTIRKRMPRPFQWQLSNFIRNVTYSVLQNY